MTTTTPESRAQIAYTAYGRKVAFRAVGGGVMPMFGELPPAVRDGWITAAGAVWDPARRGEDTPAEGLAAVAYLAYAEAVGFRTVGGDPMPRVFAEMEQERQEAWAAAAAVLHDLATTGTATIS